MKPFWLMGGYVPGAYERADLVLDRIATDLHSGKHDEHASGFKD